MTVVEFSPSITTPYENVGGSGLAFFVGNEVYDHLEKVVDRFDDVANVMHGIVIEHV